MTALLAAAGVVALVVVAVAVDIRGRLRRARILRALDAYRVAPGYLADRWEQVRAEARAADAADERGAR